MHRRLAVPMLPLRVWVHCPRASNGLLPPRSYLVGYLRWHAGSDSGFFFFFLPPSDNHSNSFQVAGRPTFPSKIRGELPVIPPESATFCVKAGEFNPEEYAKQRLPVLSRSASQFSTVEAWAYAPTGRLIIRAIFGQRWLARSPLQTTKRR